MNIKNILTGIATSIALALLTWIGISVRDVGYMREQITELKTEIKELRTELKEYQKDEWERYIELNTKTFNHNNQLKKMNN